MLPTRWVLFVVALPSTLIAYVLGALSMLCYMARGPRFEDGLVLSLEWRPWFAQRWRYSTKLFRTVWYQPHARTQPGEEATRLERHEHAHVRQFEDESLKGLLIGLLLLAVGGHVAWLFALWTMWPAMLIVNYVPAMLRWGFRNAYRDSEHERSAYAQTDTVTSMMLGSSWDRHRERKRSET